MISSSVISGFSWAMRTILLMTSLMASISDAGIPLAPDRSLYALVEVIISSSCCSDMGTCIWEISLRIST